MRLEPSSGTTSFEDPDTIAMERRAELARFLRHKRAAIQPEQVGLRSSARRRSAGLLREEVAQRAGVSASWYMWLEQGRPIRPSRDVLLHIADALLLSAMERSHLMALALSREDGAGDSEPLTQVAPPDLAAWVEALSYPAYALNGRWDVLAWNSAATELVADFGLLPAEERNILRMIFLWPSWRELFLDWGCLASSAVAQFRTNSARIAGRPEVRALINDLARQSPEFVTLWSGDQLDEPRLKVKRMQHPTHGLVELAYAPLAPRGAPADVSVIVYSPTKHGPGRLPK
ncbi:MAG: helix-turn-helix transcriptional regulator [Myxococcales bacterium]